MAIFNSYVKLPEGNHQPSTTPQNCHRPRRRQLGYKENGDSKFDPGLKAFLKDGATTQTLAFISHCYPLVI